MEKQVHVSSTLHSIDAGVSWNSLAVSVLGWKPAEDFFKDHNGGITSLYKHTH
uniref:Uncharacterized protein n=1 Tax=Anguilla anguilla TaxID=7936 RepID=A0A0E9U1H3_ANGAN